MTELKLAALDKDDLAIVSAHAQDALVKVSGFTYDSRTKSFSVTMNRYVWEKKRGFFDKRGERRLAILQFGRVLGVKTTGIDRNKPDDILNLLAVTFEEGESPSGTILLTFSAGAAVSLAVECIEVRLADTGAAWETLARPMHQDG